MTDELSQLPQTADTGLELLRAWLDTLPLSEPTVWIPLVGAATGLGLVWATAAARRSRAPEDEDPETRIQTLVEQNGYEEAAQIRLAQGQFEKALALFQHSGNLHQVALCHLALKQPKRAADVYSELGRYAEAAHYYQVAGTWKEAAECLQTLGSVREAAELYERAGDLAKAAHLLRSLGDAENAARLFERAGLAAEEAAALLAAHGRQPTILKRAGELFESSGDPRRAAECFAGASEWQTAARLFEEVKEFALAAQAYERGKAWREAAAAYERAGAYPEARANYGRAGDTLAAAKLAERLGNRLDAGRGFYAIGAYDRAVELLHGVASSSPQSRPATLLLGRIFLEKGLLTRAQEKLAEIVCTQPASKDDLEALILMAEVLERNGDTAGAVEHLERVVEFDATYEDVGTRLERLQERAWSNSVASSGAARLDRYELCDEIGRGGMGIVHRAQDRELDRTVAIKFLPPQLAERASAVKMFRQEARAAAAMNHPNIVHLYDVAVIEGRPCIVMEYVPGRTVRELMRVPGSKRKRPLPVRQVVEIARDICRALEYAHGQNVIHRDVKPGNMLIPASGITKLMDFGISKVIESSAEEDGDTHAKGTPQYMPPEQILGRGVDARTDLYALGISMFEMLTGVRPFGGDKLMEKQLKQPTPDPRAHVKGIPEVIVSVIHKATRKDPSERYTDARSMAEVLDAVLDSL